MNKNYFIQNINNYSTMPKILSEISSSDLMTILDEEKNIDLQFFFQKDICESFFKALGKENYSFIFKDSKFLYGMLNHHIENVINYIPELFSKNFKTEKTVFNYLTKQALDRPSDLFYFYHTFSQYWNDKQKNHFINCLSNDLDDVVRLNPQNALYFLQSSIGTQLVDTKSKNDIATLLTNHSHYVDLLKLIKKDKKLTKWFKEERKISLFNTLVNKTGDFKILKQSLDLSGNNIIPLFEMKNIFTFNKTIQHSINSLYEYRGQEILISDNLKAQNDLGYKIWNIRWQKKEIENDQNYFLNNIKELAKLYNNGKISLESERLKTNLYLIDMIYNQNNNLDFIKNIYNTVTCDNFQKTHFYSHLKVSNLHKNLSALWEKAIIEQAMDSEKPKTIKSKRL